MKRFFLPLLFLSSSVSAGNYLTQEMEVLKRDLKSDDPARRELTLRLADIYFDLSIKDDTENTALVIDREKSLELYQEALNGKDGFAPLQGENRFKVIFQSARLQDKLNQKIKAESLFLELHGSSQVPRNLKLEAALYLGELNEDKAKLKEAIKYYSEAIALCTSIDTCNFAHYRLGWTYFKETKLSEAINEIYLALWDAKGQLRDQAVNDLISFMSQRQTDGKKELKELEIIIEKSKNEKLMSQMAETFYLAGNREAGGRILAYINKKTPSLYNEIRLLEESYGFRKWDEVDTYLKVLSRRSSKDLPVLAEEKDEALKIHRRLIVQLDAETDTNPERAELLKRAIDLYLSFYPVDEMKSKMQEGWLTAEKDADTKITRLAGWISSSSGKELQNLRRTRLSLAQKQNNSEVVITEALALCLIADNAKDVREYEYVAAYELNKVKRTAEAEVLFKKLITYSLDKNAPDQWMIQSQNLLLDIYNTRKDLAAITQAVNLWTNHPTLKERPEFADEFASMRGIANQVKFEQAVAAGDSQESLEQFFQNCRQNILVPQSCENAKVLSVKLKDQTKLVAVLEINKDETALVNEYELMGRFSDAARLREKNLAKGKVSLNDFLKISLLYELDLNFKERNRVLDHLSIALKGSVIEPKFEKILYLTMMEAELVDAKLLNLGWSLPYKMKLVQQIEQNHSDAKTRKLLLSEKVYQGAVWSKVILDEMQKLDEAQRKVSFYNGDSKTLFKKKADMLSRFEKEVNAYLQGADAETRVYLISMVERTNQDFAAAILNTPIPAELDAKMVSQVKAHLTGLSTGYLKSAEDYGKLLADEIAAIENKELTAKVTANLALTGTQYSTFIGASTESISKTAALDYSGRTQDMTRLSIEPANANALSGLENFYTKNNSERIASYFKERIQLLNN